MWKGLMSIALLLVVALQSGCGRDTTGDAEKFVEFGELVTNAQSYHGRQICTAGVYVLGFETSALGASTYQRGSAIYLTEPSVWVQGAEIRTTGDCFTSDTAPPAEFCQAEVCGLFESGGGYGHLGGYNYQLRGVGD
jgi:hypothetical protein